MLYSFNFWWSSLNAMTADVSGNQLVTIELSIQEFILLTKVGVVTLPMVVGLCCLTYHHCIFK